MSYARIKATAEAARYITQREADDRDTARRRASAHANRMMDCGLTCAEWLAQYHANKNHPGTTPGINTEATNDDQDRREVAGTEAGPRSDGEGVGDAPPQQAQSGPSTEASEWASYLDESGAEPDQREPFETPF